MNLGEWRTGEWAVDDRSQEGLGSSWFGPGFQEVLSMRLWVLAVAGVLVLGGSLRGLAQQQTGPRTLEGLLKQDRESPARRPSAVDATEPVAPVAVPAGRISGAVARPKDGVQHPDLDAAWTEYDKQIETAAKAIEQSIERELSKAAKAGDLDAALKWKTAGEQFKKAGRIPEGMEGTKPQGRPKPRPTKQNPSQQSLVVEAQGRLEKVYEAVEKELVKSLDLEKAKQVRSERESLAPVGGNSAPAPLVVVIEAKNYKAASPKAAFVGSWQNDDNKNLEEIRADGAYIVNRDPRNEWSGTWVLDTEDPKGPCVVRHSNNRSLTRWYVDPADRNSLVGGDGVRVRRVNR